MKTLLVTGFEPFGGQSVNPSWECVKALTGNGRARIVTGRLPVIWDAGPAALSALMEECRPDAVLCVGQAGGSAHIRIERVAVNLCECATPDNAGRILCGEPVIAGGPAAYFSTLPAARIKEALQASGIPAEYSFSAGAYLCNSVMYTALHRAQGSIPAGFLHIPYMEGQTDSDFFLPLETLKRAVDIAAQAIIGSI